MTITRFSTNPLPVFKTFELDRPIDFLDVQSSNGDCSLLDRLPESGLAIVGTRYPQRRSMELLEKTIYELRNSDKIIISGLARGIDSHAHELALDFGLKTIAILGCGIDIDYPRENVHLRNRILDHGGLVLSHFERDYQPIPRNFLLRNRLIAGLAKAVWVVEAAAISGTLNTAKWASDYHRDLYATSCFPGDHFYQGNEKLLSQRMTNRYPVADPFFSALSLGKSWPELASLGQASFTFVPKSEIQKWVLELKTNYGECQVQSLMNYASTQGLTLGKFYLQYEKELSQGLITEDQEGRVDLGLAS